MKHDSSITIREANSVFVVFVNCVAGLLCCVCVGRKAEQRY